MDFQVRGNGVPVTEDLREYVTRRATRLDRLVDRVVDAKLELRALHSRGGPESTAAQITIRAGRDVIRAEERAAEPIVAIDQAFEKLERQVQRVSGKRRNRKAPGTASIRVAPEPAPDDADTLDDDESPEVGSLVRTKRFDVKPMDIDEAIEQMELLGHDFFLFHYSAEDIPSVIYRRKDGSVGLLVPKGA
ncbi:MAG: ribosome-associated translation inhibitor RaiA [Thermomicrobiales bacterium]